MKMFFSLAVLSTSLSAFASLTKHEVLKLAATRVVESGKASNIEECLGFTSRKELLKCTYEATSMDDVFLRLPPTALVKKNVSFSYYDGAGDCVLRARYEASTRAVSLKGWDCI